MFIFIRGGDILVAPSSWQWVNPNEYIHESLPDGIHTLIITCRSMWYHAKDEELMDARDGSIKTSQNISRNLFSHSVLLNFY